MKIIAVGRNYAEHAKELNNAVPDEPILFMKPETSIVRNNNHFFYPDFSSEIHYETEIVLKICKVGKNIAPEFASRYIDEIGIGIDFTARDLQNKLKSKGQPWEVAKAFDGSAPIGKFLPVANFPDFKNINFSLTINEKQVQTGNTKDLIFPFDALISYISKFFTLKIGDLIFTGTPAGVGPVKIGDRLQASIEGRVLLDFMVK